MAESEPGGEIAPSEAVRDRAALSLTLIVVSGAPGAALAGVGQGNVSWTVLADPEGGEFCVLSPRGSRR